MKNENIPQIKIRIQWELAYEMIYYSILMIILGLSFIFVSNLLSFNWITGILLIVAIILISLKNESYIIINSNWLEIKYCPFLLNKKIKLESIDEFVFYEAKRLVEIRCHNNRKIECHLAEKQKEKLLIYLIHFCPWIPCLYIQSENG